MYIDDDCQEKIQILINPRKYISPDKLNGIKIQ